MELKPNDWVTESTKVFSLDRCISCLNVMNLGEQTMCAVMLRKSGGKTASKCEYPGDGEHPADGSGKK